MNITYALNEDLYKKLQKDMRFIFATKAYSEILKALYILMVAITTGSLVFISRGMHMSYEDNPPLFIAGLILALALPISWFINRKYLARYSNAALELDRAGFGLAREIQLIDTGVSITTKIGSAQVS